MKCPETEILKSKSITSACKLLEKYGTEARAIAGGTDVVVDLKNRNIACAYLVALGEVRGLKAIKNKKDQVRIGALATLESIARSGLLEKHFPALRDAAGKMATPQVRNLGTIGGNIASAVPSADLPPPLICLGSQVEIKSAKDQRTVPVSEFFLGPRKTVLKSGELIKEIILTKHGKGTGAAYEKFQLREASALAVVGVAARITLENDTVKDACITLGAVAPTPVIAKKASQFLAGKEPSSENFTKAGEIACNEGNPISDIRGSAEYRCELIRVLAKRALERALVRATGGKA